MGASSTPLQYVIVDRLGAFFYWTRGIWQQYVYHSTIPLQYVWSVCSAN